MTAPRLADEVQRTGDEHRPVVAGEGDRPCQRRRHAFDRLDGDVEMVAHEFGQGLRQEWPADRRRPWSRLELTWPSSWTTIDSMSLSAMAPSTQVQSTIRNSVSRASDQGSEPIGVVGAVDEYCGLAADTSSRPGTVTSAESFPQALVRELPAEELLACGDRHGEIVDLVASVERQEDLLIGAVDAPVRRYPASDRQERIRGTEVLVDETDRGVDLGGAVPNHRSGLLRKHRLPR